jgi:hypothetical protein
MISASFDGYVTKQPVVEDGSYGRYVEVTLRVATAGKEVHYVSSKFFGRKIGPVEDYINNGDYITMFGCVTSIKEKQKSDGGGKYCQIYLKDACYTLPPKVTGEARFRPSLPSTVPGERLDISDFGDDDGDTF